jgi:hypothetical protein
MKIFCDMHHQDLYYSLQLLFERRLGWEMYRPIGVEWWKEEYWAVYQHPATAEQFLGIYQADKEPTDVHGNPLPERALINKNYLVEDGIYYIKDPTREAITRAITLDRFKDMQFDVLLSSIPQHIQPYNQLISQYQPQAKHIFQIGNAWGRQPGVNNLLASTAPFPVPPDVNAVFYHQEFDLGVYKYTPLNQGTVVNSYIHFMKELDVLGQFKQMLPHMSFNTYGAGMLDCLHSADAMANAMASSGWTWHMKPGGDGYGHVLHNTFACGRPPIVKTHHYTGQIGSQLLVDQVTCVDLSIRSLPEAAHLVHQITVDPACHAQMCENAYKRFCGVVDFDAEEHQIRYFLENLR